LNAAEAALAWCRLGEVEQGAAITGAIGLVAGARRFVEVEVTAGAVSCTTLTRPVPLMLEADWAWTGTVT
jgi:hypothetical protein